MAPTIIDLPAIVGWWECLFDPVVPRDLERMEGRRTESMRFGTPYWRGSWTTTALTPAQMGALEAFAMMAGDNGEVFRAYDASRPRPIDYHTDDHAPLSGTRAGGGAFDGTATITGRTAFSLTVSMLPANFQFRAGDYVEVRRSASIISLHRITADVRASASGVVTLPIRHGLDLQNFPLPLTANFEKASCLMQVDPGALSASKPLIERRASFTAQEVFFA
ncbi:hypothetical protein [Devosia sp. 2618]|uniref:hypothetical protein n=1 Tax=Devosia sp. 2618 TaxID=3156454 RepID=UPI003399AFA8